MAPEAAAIEFRTETFQWEMPEAPQVVVVGQLSERDSENLAFSEEIREAAIELRKVQDPVREILIPNEMTPEVAAIEFRAETFQWEMPSMPQAVVVGQLSEQEVEGLAFSEEIREGALELRKIETPIRKIAVPNEILPEAVAIDFVTEEFSKSMPEIKREIAVQGNDFFMKEVELETTFVQEESIGEEWGLAQNRMSAIEKEVFDLSEILSFEKEASVCAPEESLPDTPLIPLNEKAESGPDQRMEKIDRDIQLLAAEFEAVGFKKEPSTKRELQFAKAHFQKLEKTALAEIEKDENREIFQPVLLENRFEKELKKIGLDFEEKGGEDPPEITVEDLYILHREEEEEDWAPEEPVAKQEEPNQMPEDSVVKQDESQEEPNEVSEREEELLSPGSSQSPNSFGFLGLPAWSVRESKAAPSHPKCPPDNCSNRWDTVWLPKLLSVQHIWGDQEEKCIPFATNYTTAEAIFAPEYCLGTIMPMMDVRGHRFDNNTYAANIGLGGRYVPNPCSDSFCEMLGFNAYYDYRQGCIGYYHQIGVGIEVLSRWWDFRANAYAPFGPRRHIHTCTFDYPGDYHAIRRSIESISYSFNAEIGWLMFELPESFLLYAAAGPYFIARTKFDEGVVGVEVRLRPQYRDYLALDLSWRYDHLFETIWQVGIIFNLPLYQIGGRNKTPCSLTDRQIYQPIQRFEVMPLSKKTCWETNF